MLLVLCYKLFSANTYTIIIASRGLANSIFGGGGDGGTKLLFFLMWKTVH